jgi:hypothetical protein
VIRSFLRKGAVSKEADCLATAEPNQPGGLTATAVSTTTISLSWTADSTAAPNEATSYAVERSIDGLGSWSTIATNLTSPSYSDASLSASQTRYYRVSAYNCFGGSLASATANATTQAGGLSPSWSLDFSSGTPSGYTLTRASSGTYLDSSGYVASAASDIARLTHDSSGTRLGLLVEESRTNEVTQSADLSTTWIRDGIQAFGSGSTANAATAPDNTTTADLVTETTVSGRHGVYSNANGFNLPFNTQYTISIYAKKPATNGRDHVSVGVSFGSGNGIVVFDVVNGTYTGNNGWGGGTLHGYGISAAGNGWYRCTVTFSFSGTGNATTGSVRVGPAISTATNSFGLPAYQGNGTSGILLWGAQMETGSSATAYIPTTTATVTRSADLAHVLDSSITSWGDPGAVVVQFYPPGKAGTLLSTDDAATAQVGIEASSTTAARAFWSSGNTATGTIGTGVQKAVHYWNGSTSKFCINGGTVQSGTNNLTIANTDFVTLGAEATESSGVPGTFSQYANCVIRKVEFYSGTLTDANLQTITT